MPWWALSGTMTRRLRPPCCVLRGWQMLHGNVWAPQATVPFMPGWWLPGCSAAWRCCAGVGLLSCRGSSRAHRPVAAKMGTRPCRRSRAYFRRGVKMHIASRSAGAGVLRSQPFLDYQGRTLRRRVFPSALVLLVSSSLLLRRRFLAPRGRAMSPAGITAASLTSPARKQKGLPCLSPDRLGATRIRSSAPRRPHASTRLLAQRSDLSILTAPGKTRLAHPVRHRAPTRGHVLVDGRDIAELQPLGAPGEDSSDTAAGYRALSEPFIRRRSSRLRGHLGRYGR